MQSGNRFAVHSDAHLSLPAGVESLAAWGTVLKCRGLFRGVGSRGGVSRVWLLPNHCPSEADTAILKWHGSMIEILLRAWHANDAARARRYRTNTSQRSRRVHFHLARLPFCGTPGGPEHGRVVESVASAGSRPILVPGSNRILCMCPTPPGAIGPRPISGGRPPAACCQGG